MTCNKCKSGAGPFIDGTCAYCHIKAARREAAEAMREAAAQTAADYIKFAASTSPEYCVEIVAGEIRALPLPGDDK